MIVIASMSVSLVTISTVVVAEFTARFPLLPSAQASHPPAEPSTTSISLGGWLPQLLATGQIVSFFPTGLYREVVAF